MTNIKNLMVFTKEGLSVKNYKTFPSREWGEDGGLQADVYLNSVYVGQVFDAGDGGMAMFNGSAKDNWDVKDLKTACFKFLRRKDKDFRNCKFMPKQASELNEDDYAMAVRLMACYYTGKVRRI